MGSAFFHLMINDTTGFIGNALRAIVGTYTEKEVIVIIATVQLITLLAQVLFSPEANLFTPFHKLFYLVFQVHGPAAQVTKPGEDIGWALQTRIILERSVEVFRVLFVLLVLSTHVWLSVPPASISSQYSPDLAVGQAIGSCQYLPALTGCSPRYLALHAVTLDTGALTALAKNTKKDLSDVVSYRLALYTGAPESVGDSFRARSWVPACKDTSAPAWSLDMRLPATSDNRAAWATHCSATASATYPYAAAETQTCPSGPVDAHKWGESCRTVARVTAVGQLQLVLLNKDTKQELLLFQHSASGLCGTNSSSAQLVISPSTGLPSVVCSNGDTHTLAAKATI